MMVKLIFILVISLISLSHALEIDVKFKNEESCDRRSLQVTCKSSATELGSNKLIIYMGTTELTGCQRLGMNCSKVKDKRASQPMFDGETAILDFKMADSSNTSITWSCMAGSIKAETKTLFLGKDPCNMDRPWHSPICGMTAIIIIGVLLVAIVLLGLCLLYKICREKCRGCCSRENQPATQNGYQGKRYDVRMDYIVDDPNHVPDASAKNMPVRTEEARHDCEKCLSIDINTDNANSCDNSYMQVICTSSATEMGANKLAIARDASVITECQRNGMTCSEISDSRFQTDFNGETAILKVTRVNYKNDSTTWSCAVGTTIAKMKVKFTGGDPCKQPRSDGEAMAVWRSGIISLITLVVAVIILILIVGVILIKICRGSKCKCLICGSKKEDEDVEVKTGYQGKHWDVKDLSTNKVTDRYHVPDATSKKVPSRSEEAKRHCEYFDSQKKEEATKKLQEFVEARTPPPVETADTPLIKK